MMLPMDLSISSISGDVDAELLAEVVPVLGLVVVDEASLLLDVPLVLSEELELLAESLSVSWPAAWDTGNKSEGSFVMVLLELGCGVAEGEALGGRCYGWCFCLLVWNALCDNLPKGDQQVWVCHIESQLAPPVSSRGALGLVYACWNGLDTAHWVIVEPGLLGPFTPGGSI